MKLENIRLSGKKKQTSKGTCWFVLHEMSRRGKSILRRLLKSYTIESWNHIIFKITQGQIDTESQKPRPWCWVWLSTLESRRPPGPLTQRWQRHQYCTLQPDLELPRDGASTSDGLIRRPCKSWPAGACCCELSCLFWVCMCVRVLLVMGVACSVCLSVGLVQVPGAVRGGRGVFRWWAYPPARPVIGSCALSQAAAPCAWAHPWKWLWTVASCRSIVFPSPRLPGTPRHPQFSKWCPTLLMAQASGCPALSGIWLEPCQKEVVTSAIREYCLPCQILLGNGEDSVLAPPAWPVWVCLSLKVCVWGRQFAAPSSVWV